MRFKIEKVEKPEIGETRVIKKFFWKPKVIGNEWIWLEFAWVKQKYLSVNRLRDEWKDKEIIYPVPNIPSIPPMPISEPLPLNGYQPESYKEKSELPKAPIGGTGRVPAKKFEEEGRGVVDRLNLKIPEPPENEDYHEYR